MPTTVLYIKYKSSIIRELRNFVLFAQPLQHHHEITDGFLHPLNCSKKCSTNFVVRFFGPLFSCFAIMIHHFRLLRAGKNLVSTARLGFIISVCNETPGVSSEILEAIVESLPLSLLASDTSRSSRWADACCSATTIGEEFKRMEELVAVSYTHLTLPTILLV